MALPLKLFAVMIFLVYSVYFIKIISGAPSKFENELVEVLSEWAQKGNGSGSPVCLLFLTSLFIEVCYFVLVFLVVKNPVFIVFTVIFVGVELYHIFRVGKGLKGYLQGLTDIEFVLDFKFERISATLFFTHSFLLLFILFLF